MALFEREETDFGIRRRHPRAVGDRRREPFRRARLREAGQRLRRVLRPDAASRPPRRARSDGHQAGSHILEVGVGTGINTSLYPSNCQVTGIDLSSSMLDKARERVAREGLRNVRLLEMDAANLTFADDSFDIVYAPYLVSVVPDPVQVVREMRRVCKPGGKIIILNHFRSANPILSRVERAISPLHRSHRLQVGSRPARLPRAGRPAAGLDREGERPEDLVAGDLR